MDFCLSFPLYLHPPPKAGDVSLTYPLCWAPIKCSLLSRPVPSSQSHPGVLVPHRPISLLAPENCDQFSCHPDLNTAPAGTLPLHWLTETSKLPWPALPPPPHVPVPHLLSYLVMSAPPASGAQALGRKKSGKEGTGGHLAGLSLRSKRRLSPRSAVSKPQPMATTAHCLFL